MIRPVCTFYATRLAPLFIQSEVKPIVTRLHAFFRPLRQLPVITSSFDLVHWIVCVLCDWLE